MYYATLPYRYAIFAPWRIEAFNETLDDPETAPTMEVSSGNPIGWMMLFISGELPAPDDRHRLSWIIHPNVLIMSNLDALYVRCTFSTSDRLEPPPPDMEEASSFSDLLLKPMQFLVEGMALAVSFVVAVILSRFVSLIFIIVAPWLLGVLAGFALLVLPEEEAEN